jgi:hypothetical protein
MSDCDRFMYAMRSPCHVGNVRYVVGSAAQASGGFGRELAAGCILGGIKTPLEMHPLAGTEWRELTMAKLSEVRHDL